MKEFPHDKILIFTDGACSGNPGRGGWGAVIVLPGGEVRELGDHSPSTTNNRMEIAAALFALKAVAEEKAAIWLYTDSVYVIRGITQWIWGWRKRGWKTAEGQDVSNRDQWEELAKIVAARPASAGIEWRFVRGHNGVPGNERVDEIAVAFSKSQPANLYVGPITRYDVAIFDLPESHELPEMKEKQKKQAAYSYVSVVDGKAQRHQTWSECEARVKGRSGARFKKAMSVDDEAEILAAWGVRLE